MNDLISRKKAINETWKEPSYTDPLNVLTEVRERIKALPTAQPALPEWAQKVEKCRKNAPECIHNPLAWALYQVWKEYDR